MLPLVWHVAWWFRLTCSLSLPLEAHIFYNHHVWLAEILWSTR